jgi:hypothetical protein
LKITITENLTTFNTKIMRECDFFGKKKLVSNDVGKNISK